jgi:hypothetical protein
MRSRATDSSSISVMVIHKSLSMAGSLKYCGFLPLAMRGSRTAGATPFDAGFRAALAGGRVLRRGISVPPPGSSR